MTKIKLAIFDIDGTLVNSVNDIAASLNNALQICHLPQHGADKVLTFIGDGVEDLIRRALPVELRKDSELQVRMLELFVKNYRLNGTKLTEPYEGIIELLETLNADGVLIAIASNKYHTATEMVAKHFFGNIDFTMIEGRRMERATKPNPQIVFDILNHTGIKPDEAIFIGDSDVDMQTARNANVKAVGVSWGYRSRSILLEAGADIVVDHPKEILVYS